MEERRIFQQIFIEAQLFKDGTGPGNSICKYENVWSHKTLYTSDDNSIIM